MEPLAASGTREESGARIKGLGCGRFEISLWSSETWTSMSLCTEALFQPRDGIGPTPSSKSTIYCTSKAEAPKPSFRLGRPGTPRAVT